MKKKYLAKIVLFAAMAAIMALAGLTVSAQRKNGTTLAGYKTIDICSIDALNWRYSGYIAVWNEGAIDTSGFAIVDVLENKPGNKWLTFNTSSVFAPAVTEIPAGTTLATATVFSYSYDLPAQSGYIRNTVNMTILNHSGQLGKAFGPSPKATYDGLTPPPPCLSDDVGGCSYSQGYWGNKPGVIWPAPYDRNALFFLSGLTWQQVLDTPPGGNGYIILAKQYIATVLNKANGAEISSGTQDTLDLATAFFASNTTPAAACPANNSCGLQKNWGGTLDQYIKDNHCGDE